MKLGVIIDRITYYRHLGPVVDAALAAGWEVQCWHRDEPARDPSKAYQIPTANPAPAFRNGRPEVRPFADSQALRCLVAGVDRVLSQHGRSEYPGLDGMDTPWATIQHGIDYFNVGADNILSSEINCLYSEFWIGFFRRLLELAGTPEASELADQLARKSRLTGVAQLDGIGHVDREAFRRRLDIPPGRPIVTYLPSSPCAHQKLTPWCRSIYAEPSRVRQLWHAVRDPRMLKYIPHVLRGWNDQALLRAVRAFCDRNGASLLVKSRAKTPPSARERAVADRVLLDESYYPPTFLEVIAISDLVIGFVGSTTVTEAVYAGVPYLLIDLPRPESVIEWNQGIFSALEADEDPAFWRCEGVLRRVPLGQALRGLGSWRLEDFSVDPSARDRYVRRLLGFSDGSSARRVVEALEAM